MKGWLGVKTGFYVRMVTFSALFLLCASANAAQWCTGQVQSVLVDGSGNVAVLATFRGDWLSVCSTEAPWKGVAANTCKSWLGLLSALRISRENVLIYYSGNDPCNAIPSYGNAPAPGYVALAEP